MQVEHHRRFPRLLGLFIQFLGATNSNDMSTAAFLCVNTIRSVSSSSHRDTHHLRPPSTSLLDAVCGDGKTSVCFATFVWHRIIGGVVSNNQFVTHLRDDRIRIASSRARCLIASTHQRATHIEESPAIAYVVLRRIK